MRVPRPLRAYSPYCIGHAAGKTAPRCTYDAGAFGHILDRRDYLAADLNHLSIHGHAKAAAVAWAAMRRAHVLPRAR